MARVEPRSLPVAVLAGAMAPGLVVDGCGGGRAALPPGRGTDRSDATHRDEAEEGLADLPPSDDYSGMKVGGFGCLVIALATAVVLGCGGGTAVVSPDEVTWRSSAEEREAALRVLLGQLAPEDVEIAGPYLGDCSEVLPDPNCISMNLMWTGVDFDQRKAVIMAMAKEHGWEAGGETSQTGGDFVGFERQGYFMYFAVFREELYPNCEPPGESLISLCRDTVRVYLTR